MPLLLGGRGSLHFSRLRSSTAPFSTFLYYPHFSPWEEKSLLGTFVCFFWRDKDIFFPYFLEGERRGPPIVPPDRKLLPLLLFLECP